MGIKHIFLVVFCVALGSCSLCAMDHGSPPPAPRKKSANETPGRSALQAASQKALTPLTAAEKLRDGARETNNGDSLRKCVIRLVDKLDAAASCGLSDPGRSTRFEDVVVAGHELSARSIASERCSAGAASPARMLDDRWRNSPLKDAFCRLAGMGGELLHVPIRHIMEGDDRGGCHFLSTAAMRDKFVADTCYFSGHGPIENCDTGVMYGVRKSDAGVQSCTVMCGLDESAVVSLISAVRSDSRSICSSRSCLGWSSGVPSFPFEMQAKSVGDVSTVYPLLAFVEWHDHDPAICVAHLACDGSDCSIFKSSVDLLDAARTALRSFSKKDRRLWPLHYVDEAKDFAIVDVAPLVSDDKIQFGIYVHMPLSCFDSAFLKIKYPDLFS